MRQAFQFVSNFSKSKWRLPISFFFVFLTVLMCYGHTLHYPFVWDDEEMIVGNPLIRSFSSSIQTFTTGAFLEKLNADTFYRPLQLISYSLNYAISDLDPFGFRLTNVLIHGLSTCLLLFLLLRLRFSFLLSFFLALLWAVHPLHIESVTYVSGRGDALFLCFSLLALTLFTYVPQKNYLLPVSLLLWCGAILSKENAISVPLLMLGYLWLNKDQWPTQKARLVTGLSTLSVLLGYLILRFGFMAKGDSGTLSNIAYSTLYERILTLPYLIVTYFRLWIFPFNLHMEYHYVESSLFNPYLWIGLPLVGLLLWGLVKLSADKKWALAFIAWIFLALGPVYHIPIALASTVREHWFYLPSIGLIFLLAEACREPKEKVARFLPLLFVVPFLFWGTQTYLRNLDWESGKSLYTHDVALEPNSFLLHNNLGVIYFREKNWKEAQSCFEKSIETAPGEGYGTAYNNLGVIKENDHLLDEAEYDYKKSIQLSQYPLAFSNLGRLLITQKRFNEAIPVLETGVNAHPFTTDLWHYLGICFYMTHQFPKSEAVFQRAAQLDPGNPQYKAILLHLRTLQSGQGQKP